MKRLGLIVFIFLSFYSHYSVGQPKDSLLLTKEIPSIFFGGKRDIVIALPAEYYAQPQRRFPVVYLFDAQSDDLFNFTLASMRYLRGTNSLDPMILIGIKTKNRHFEFTPKNNTADPYGYNPAAKFWKNLKLGGADTLWSNLEAEVFPYVEKNYRTLPVRLGLGHSLGGTFVTYCLTQKTSAFDALVVVSPNYAYDQEQMVERVKRYIEREDTLAHFFYLARGKRSEVLFNEGIEKVASFIIIQKPQQVLFRYDLLDIDNHGNTLLEGFVKGLMTYHSSIYSSARTIIDYYTKLSHKAGYQLDAGQINQLAYDNFMRPDCYQQATEIFAWGIRLYPEDYNLHDSMSEAQENLGNKKQALAYNIQSLAILERQKGKIAKKDYEGAKKYFSEKRSRLKK